MEQTSKSPKLSIVIPVYNEEAHLAACLEAIAVQTVAPLEVLVVDNNSTDTSVKIAKEYSFVTILHEKMQGIVHTRNRGFNAAKGDIIARIDADTRLPEDWVALVIAFFTDSKNAKQVSTGSCYFYNLHSGRLTGRIYDLIVHRINRALLGHYFPWGSNSALPRTAWEKARNQVCIRDDIHEDLDLGIHLKRAGYSVAYRSNIRVGAVARRIVTERGDLWNYLMMWPHTFRVHHTTKWRLILPVAAGVWLGSYWVFVVEKIGDLISSRRD